MSMTASFRKINHGHECFVDGASYGRILDKKAAWGSNAELRYAIVGADDYEELEAHSSLRKAKKALYPYVIAALTRDGYAVSEMPKSL